MPDDPSDSEHGRPLAVWQCVFALFQDELGHAAAEALARGTPAGRLAEQIEERIDRLRRQITIAGQDGPPG